MQSFLSENEKIQLRKQHKHERDKRICDRIKAVLLFDEGWNLKQIAHVLLLDDETIRIHIQDYKNAYKLKADHKGSFSKLDPMQTKCLLSHLENTTYLYVKDITSYVRCIFGVSYSIAGMTFWLKQHGFSYKKPALVPGKANRIAQELWLKEYEHLKKTLPYGETICFLDGVHPTHNAKSAYGWIRKGTRKEIFTNTGRKRLNLSGALNIFSKNVFIREDTTLNANATVKFLQELELNYPEATKIHIFCDNARYYKNRIVQEYLAHSKIEMHFLPPYSPNLNPIERLWKLMNECILYNKYYEKFKDFKEAVMGFLQETIHKEPMSSKLRKRITDNFQLIH